MTALAAAGITTPLQAQAAPVDVRAPTRLHVGLERVGAEVVVSGTLLDELNDGVSTRSVTLVVRAVEDPTDETIITVVTDVAGRFEARMPARPGPRTYDVHVSFAGTDDGLLLPADMRTSLDAARKRPVLDITGPTTFATSGRGVPYEVRARPVVAGLALALHIASRGTERLAGKAITSAEGTAVFVVEPEEVEAGGPVTLIARSEASELLGLEAAEGRLELRALEDTRLSLEAGVAAGESVELGTRLFLTGTLIGLSGDGAEPLDGESVALYAEGPGGREEEIGIVETDRAGRFRAALDTSRYDRAGALALRAAYAPHVVWRAPAASPGLQLRLTRPEPLPVLLYIVPLAIALGAVGVTLIRGRRRREREKVAAVAPAEVVEVQAGLLASAPASGGATAAAPGRSAASLLHLGGLVVDAVKQHGVAGATVELIAATASGNAIVATAGPDGAWETGDLPEGMHELRVRAPGYVAERFTVRLPHRGELSDLHVALAPVRQRVLEAFRKAAVAHLPKRGLLFVWTARELGRHVRRQRPWADRPVGELGRLFDRTFFSAEVADERAAEVAQILAEQARAPAPAPSPAAAPGKAAGAEPES